MNEEQQLKIQAFLDGELSEQESREMSALLARDEEATALSKELRNTRQVLKSSETNLHLPESREFYWSKIQREIERSERVPSAAPRLSLFQIWRRIIVSAGAVAALALVGIIAVKNISPVSGSPDSEMTVADSGAFTYHDYANGTTLVWVSYPAER